MVAGENLKSMVILMSTAYIKFIKPKQIELKLMEAF